MRADGKDRYDGLIIMCVSVCEDTTAALARLTIIHSLLSEELT